MKSSIVLFFLTTCLTAGTVMAQEWPPIPLERHGKELRLVDPVVHRSLPEPTTQPPSLPAPRTITPLMQPADLGLYQVVTTEKVTGQLKPSQAVVRRYSPFDGTLGSANGGPASGLTQMSLDAIERAPNWLKTELKSNLALMTAEVQDRLATVLVTLEDDRFIDEVAFLLANVAPEDLSRAGFRREFLVDQARLIYEAAPLLDYVELVEHGSLADGDFWTTTVYSVLEDGVPTSYELPFEEYYWYIVHPKLDGEELLDINPLKGTADTYPDGTTFREYFLFAEDPSYTHHFLFEKPLLSSLEPVLEESLNGWNPTSRGYFPSFAVDPLVLTRDGEGRATTVEFRVGTGTVLATTLRVEEAYKSDASNLLENLLLYGAGNVVLNQFNRVLVVTDDPIPDGVDLLSSIFDMESVPFDRVASADFADTVLEDYDKVLVLSNQGASVVGAIVNRKEELESWLSGASRILELHLAPEEGDWDPSGLVFPGGIVVAGGDLPGNDVAVVGGQPSLADTVAGTSYLWDLEVYPGLSGGRPLLPDTFLLDKVTWWGSQNMFDSVAERREKYPGYVERSNYSPRILRNHYGNCGELQDLLTSAFRTCLVPITNVSNGPEDHVWNEFRFRDEWFPMQIDWSDGPSRIADPSICYGKKWGGGKNVSAVVQYRGDGYLENRTELYANTFDLELDITDTEGNPLDGAEVVVFTESYYEDNGEYPLTVAWWGIADAKGKVSLKLGANENDPISDCEDLSKRCNNYYVRVLTYFGVFPVEDGSVELVVAAQDAIPASSHSRALSVPTDYPVSSPESVLEGNFGDPTRVVRVTVDGIQEMACGLGLYGGATWCDPAESGTLDLMILDQANYSRLSGGEPFDALALAESVEPGYQLAFHPGQSSDWYVILRHQHRYQYEALVDVTFEVLERTEEGAVEEEPDIVTSDSSDSADAVQPEQDITADVDPSLDVGSEAGGNKSSGGCSVGVPSGATPELLGLLLLLVMLLAIRREVIGE